MALKKTIAKLNDYYGRLESKKADRIKLKHVDKVIAKLRSSEEKLVEEIAEAKKSSKKERLERKKMLVAGQLERAEWLRNEIGKSK